MVESVRLADGRMLSLGSWGPADGAPMLLLHGTPGSRSWRPGSRCLDHVAERHVRLVSVSRPGYGGSDRAVGRTLSSFADDLAVVVDQLGWSDGWSVIGVSGGGPHALACRGVVDGVRAIAVLSGVGELCQPGAYTGMVDGSAALWRSAFTPGGALEMLISKLGPRLQGADRHAAAAKFLATFPADDADLLAAEPELATVMLDDVIEAFTGGGWGWLDDARALTSPWQFATDGSTIPVRWWHGALDRFVPVHTAQRAVDQLAHSELVIADDLAHMGAVETNFNDAIDWLLSQ